MTISTIVRRAAARARTRNEEEAVANLAAGYQQMMGTVATAMEGGYTHAAADFRRKARRYLAGLRLIARGADIFRVYKRVTGSLPWTEK